jgi:gliding motility-associated-like protein
VASTTSSPDFPIASAFQDIYAGGVNDGVVFKFNDNLTDLLWSTFIGGSQMDAVYSIRVDNENNVFAGGGTNSDDYPTTPNVIKPDKPNLADIDGVISLIASTGDSLISSSYIGTASYDQVYMIDLDSSQNVYLLGQTQGNYPITDSVYSNPGSGQFIHKLGRMLDTTYFSTTIGSRSRSPDIRPTAFLVNECENIYISGWGGVLNTFPYIGGSTNNLPITSNAYQKDTDGSDFYLMVLLKDVKKLLYATYFGELGGRGDHVDGGTSRFDKRGMVYQSVCGSCGATQGFPTSPEVWSNTNNSPNCNNAAFKFDLASLLARFTTDSPEFDDPGVTSGCDPFTVVFLNRSLGGEDYFWDFGEGTTTDQPDSITVEYPGPGVYDVSLTATDINTCVRESVARGKISVFDFDFSIMESDSICANDEIELRASGGVTYRWSPVESLSNPNIPNPIARPDTTTQYNVFVVDANDCDFEDSLVITVVPEVIPAFEVNQVYDCVDAPEFRFTNLSENSEMFYWDFGDGNSSEEFEPVYRFQEEDTFKVTLVAETASCVEVTEQDIVSIKPFIPNFFSPNGDSVNDQFEVISNNPVNLKIFNRWGKLVYSEEIYENQWNAEGLASGVYYYEITFSDNITNCNGWVHVMR